jgi:hypothetical protein
MVLDFNDPRWDSLAHAYGSGRSLVPVLEAFARHAEDDDTWEELVSSVFHQGTIYTASYAVVPHLVALAESRPEDSRFDLLYYAGRIAAAAEENAAPKIPEFLATDYGNALERAARLTHELLADPRQGGPKLPYLLAAYAAFRRSPEAATLLFDTDFEDVSKQKAKGRKKKPRRKGES